MNKRQATHRKCEHRLFATLLLLSLVASAAGCGSEVEADPDREKMVLVDQRTFEVVVVDAASDTPAVNPKTGKKTLMPGLYCPKCQQWRPAPPIDEINRLPGAGLCPKCRGPMTIDGPWPAGPSSKE